VPGGGRGRLGQNSWVGVGYACAARERKHSLRDQWAAGGWRRVAGTL